MHHERLFIQGLACLRKKHFKEFPSGIISTNYIFRYSMASLGHVTVQRRTQRKIIHHIHFDLNSKPSNNIISFNNRTISSFDNTLSCTFSNIKEALEKSTPELEENDEALLNATTECLDYDLGENLNDNSEIDMDDEDKFITASDNINDIVPS